MSWVRVPPRPPFMEQPPRAENEIGFNAKN